MKIAININELTLQQNTGVKVYTREIVKALGRIDKENEYILYCNSRDEALPRLYGDFGKFKKFKTVLDISEITPRNKKRSAGCFVYANPSRAIFQKAKKYKNSRHGS